MPFLQHKLIASSELLIFSGQIPLVVRTILLEAAPSICHYTVGCRWKETVSCRYIKDVATSGVVIQEFTVVMCTCFAADVESASQSCAAESYSNSRMQVVALQS